MVDLGRVYYADEFLRGRRSGRASANDDGMRIDAAESLRADMLRTIGHAPRELIGDGKFHRFSTKANGRGDAGYYRFHDDEYPYAIYGDYRSGRRFTWSAREPAVMDAAERERLDRVKAERERQAEACRATSSERAEARWERAKPASPDHPYLKRKGIQPHGCRQQGNVLLVPMLGDDGFSLQAIRPDGSKKFQSGAPATGCFEIAGQGDTIIIAEGFATAATLAEATGSTVIAAFSAHNLEAVARAARENNPTARIIIAADDDRKTELETGRNPGLRAAEKAARDVGMTVAAPPFDREKDGDEPSDWNDFQAIYGPGDVAMAFGWVCDGGQVGQTSSSRSNAASVEIETISAASLADKPVPEQRWLVRELIPAGNVTLLTGDGGTGKSLLALQLAVAVATSGNWLGYSPEPGRVLFVSAEDELDELHRRLARMGAHLPSLIWLEIANLACRDAFLAAPEKNGLLGETPLLGELRRIVEQGRPALVVLDTLADLFGGDEIKKVHARAFIAMLRGLALEFDTTILLLGHPSQSGLASGSGMSGNTAWNNSVRSRLYFDRRTTRGERGEKIEDDRDLRVMTVMKANRAAAGGEIVMRYCHGQFVLEEPTEASMGSAKDQAQRAERKFLELLAQFTKEGRTVSDRPGANYAPKTFAEHPSAGGMSKTQLTQAMNRLFAAEKIRVDVVGPPSRPQRQLALANMPSADAENEDHGNA